jgi:hypothetical protein
MRRRRMPRLVVRPGESRWAVRVVVLAIAIDAMLNHHGFWFIW